MKGLLLDTHIWIWLMEGMELNGRQRKLINEAAASQIVGFDQKILTYAKKEHLSVVSV